MKALYERLKFHGLFIKMFAVMFVSIIAIAVSVAWTNLRMTEKLFLETFSITNSKVMNQVKSNFESFHYSNVLAAMTAQQSGTLKTFLTEKSSGQSTKEMNAYYGMTQQMRKIQTTVDAYSAGIAIVGKNGRNYSGNSYLTKPNARELYGSALTPKAEAAPGKMMYHLYEGQAEEGGKPFIVATKVLQEPTTGQKYGMLYITIDEKDFKPFYSSFTSEGNDVVIIDSSGTVMSSNHASLVGQKNVQLLSYAREIQEQGLHVKKVKMMSKDELMLAQYLPSYNFYLVNMIDQKQVLGQMVNTKSIILLVLVIVLVALIIVFLISRKMTRSLTLLSRQMSKVTSRNFHNYVNVSGGYEIRQLGEAYNYMLDEVNDYVARLVHTQQEQRKAELAALQQQINPHFLYNTLASVKFLVQQGSKEKAVDTIHALISLLQNTISSVSETITVEEELVSLKHYVFINHIRYGERIRVSYFVAPDCNGYHVPKLMIQPFIENAFFHAFNEKESGFIHVLISSDGRQLICEVVDNGDGMDMQQLEQARDKRNQKGSRQLFSGIGVANVHERIRLLYGEDYGVTIASGRGEGTKVRITMPIIEHPPESGEEIQKKYQNPKK
ncbi:cache domain-containing sensor histidine kinase [Paenibacillus azoreducens]|uniref:Histidine kinase n=1 Tax=Paenibacillus azoreducens TaxID=116718 RepID=A0A919Y9J3_9BACL|nr:sensor histidine kinase [Paenibacillus azoreducens]GIO46684.1 histidine kinase [Paenibacillus azoreducens]